MAAATFPLAACTIICCEAFKDGDKVLRLNCGHLICKNLGCVVGIKDKCPICRAQRDLSKERMLVITQKFLDRQKPQSKVPQKQ